MEKGDLYLQVVWEQARQDRSQIDNFVLTHSAFAIKDTDTVLVMTVWLYLFKWKTIKWHMCIYISFHSVMHMG